MKLFTKTIIGLTLICAVFTSNTYAGNTSGQKVSINEINFNSGSIYFQLSSEMFDCKNGTHLKLNENSNKDLYAALLNTYATNGKLIIEWVHCYDGSVGDLNSGTGVKIRFSK
ncbi:MAG: hypothetical protein OCD01_04190 [Fibrobacterales bacterium]